jgi:uncharacterized protein (UPF0333 family)
MKGQITIEALFVLGVFILLITSISIPNVFRTVEAARDVRIVSDARYAAEQIATVVNSIGENEKRTFDVYIPGYSSESVTMETCISVDGNLNTTVKINKSGKTESYSFLKTLQGDWESVNGTICEDKGKRYVIEISWGKIVFGGLD